MLDWISQIEQAFLIICKTGICGGASCPEGVPSRERARERQVRRFVVAIGEVSVGEWMAGQAGLGLSSGAAHDAMGGDAYSRLAIRKATWHPPRSSCRTSHPIFPPGRILVVTEPFLQSRDGLTWCYRSAYSNPPAVAAALTSRRIINRENLLEWQQHGLRGLVGWCVLKYLSFYQRGAS